MATINNGEIIRNIIDKAKINTLIDDVPKQLAEKVVPVMEVNNMPVIKVKIKELHDATGTNIFTSDSDKRTYITGLHLSVSKSSTSNSTATYINFTPWGATSINILKILHEPLTAGQLNANIQFEKPVLIEKNTIVFVGTTSGTASIDYFASVFYYEQDE